MARHNWQPLIDGSARDSALDRIAIIASELSGVAHAVLDPALSSPIEDEILASPFLAGGTSGLALFFHFLGIAQGSPHCVDLARRLIERAVEDAGTVTELGLFSGLSGIGFALQNIAPDDPIAAILLDSLDARVDEFMRDAMRSDRLVGLDLLTGIAGVGIYLHSRPPSARVDGALAACDELLMAHAVTDGDGVTWERAPFPADVEAFGCSEGERFVDMGVARGYPGILSVVLANRMRLSRRGTPATSSLMKPLFDAIEDGDDGPSFRFSIGRPVEHDPDYRFGWCYGRLGVASVMLASGAHFDRHHKERILGVARRCAEGLVPDFHIDAALCHGTAGTAHMFSRLFEVTREDAFAAAARRWYLETLRRATDSSGIGAYVFWESPGTPARTAGLLRGAAGVAMALLSAVYPNTADWDRLFMLGEL
jgi:hypothetical protein